MIEPERIQRLNAKEVQRRKYVLYWMQASQRAEYNHALEYAVLQANEQNLPLVTVFGLTDDYPEANLRHYAFMLEGVKEVQQSLQRRGIQLILRYQSPDSAALGLAEEASLLVTDRGYTRLQKKWRRSVAEKATCPVIQVESDVVVPVEVVSQKEEYAAATIRPKILKHLNRYLNHLKKNSVRKDSLGFPLDTLDVQDVDGLLCECRIDRSVPRQSIYEGGTSKAKKWLDQFIAEKLNDYADHRNDPSLGIQSNMSPYLHFGQISPVYVAIRVQEATGKNRKSKQAYLEELIVRRELSMNFIHYNSQYDSFSALPDWARATLHQHERDPRDYVYTRKQLEEAHTHDPYWNAAMREMVLTGKMANYMRMYWGKKILEWTPKPERAFRNALYLNNKYFLDGRDPNSFAGVAWCFGKHDRPWGERPVFGKVRYMNDAGLQRKFDIEAYVRRVQDLRP